MLPDLPQHENLESRASIIVLLQGIDEPLSFSLKPEAAIRLRKVVYNENNVSSLKTFFCFDDVDGARVAISIDQIQMVNFLFDIGIYDGPLGQGDPLAWDIEIYFRDRAKPYKSVAEDLEELNGISVELDIHPEDDEGWLSYTDEDGEPIHFRTAHVLAFIARPQIYDEELD